MKTEADVHNFERLVVQLQALQAEISQLAKKSPNDGLNKFKLKLVNTVLVAANELFVGNFKPVEGFELFDEDDLPTNSDVAMVLTLYIEQSERFRSANVAWDAANRRWCYTANKKLSNVEARPPTKIGSAK